MQAELESTLTQTMPLPGEHQLLLKSLPNCHRSQIQCMIITSDSKQYKYDFDRCSKRTICRINDNKHRDEAIDFDDRLEECRQFYSQWTDGRKNKVLAIDHEVGKPNLLIQHFKPSLSVIVSRNHHS